MKSIVGGMIAALLTFVLKGGLQHIGKENIQKRLRNWRRKVLSMRCYLTFSH